MIYDEIDRKMHERTEWVLRRQMGIPNNRKLFVLACMDERLPVEDVLGIGLGDAHIFRNAGGLVTDDVIRSAVLTTRFFGTEEIIIVNHTECGMMSASPDQIMNALQQRVPDLLNGLAVDPLLPEFRLTDRDAYYRWLKMFDDVDQTAEAQVGFLRNHPLIPDHVEIHAYIYEVETGSLRRPHVRLGDRVNTANAMQQG